MYIVIGVDSGVIWAADFDNGISCKVRRPARRQGSPADRRRHIKLLRIYCYWCRFWGH